MRKLLLTVMALSLIATTTAATAQAHLVKVPDHPNNSLLDNRLASQKENVAHARYVCKNGARANKVWHCKAVIWLRREYRETYVALNPPRVSIKYLSSWICIHGHEGAWNANTGNGYYGGLQMDWSFMKTYGPELLRTKGTADKWTPYEQMMVAERAHKTRGFNPWPNTARYCGLL